MFDLSLTACFLYKMSDKNISTHTWVQVTSINKRNVNADQLVLLP